LHRWTRTCLVLLFAAFATPAASQPGSGNCIMGETRNATFGQPGLYGLGITVYQWFDPTDCALCVTFGGAIQIKTVELQVFRSISVNWTIDATISVIGWTGSAACPEPDESVVLLAPQPISFTVPLSHQLALTDVRAPVANSPLFVAPAFLVIRFTPVSTTPVNVSVGQIDAPTCTNCRQYVTAEAQGVVKADACSAGGAALYPWVCRPRGDCVSGATTVRPGAWGSVKSLYR
jgi:hypothetical protein